MRAKENEIKEVLLGFKSEMDLFVNTLYVKRLNIGDNLKTKDLNTIALFDKDFGKEMFYAAIEDILRDKEINDMLNQ